MSFLLVSLAFTGFSACGGGDGPSAGDGDGAGDGDAGDGDGGDGDAGDGDGDAGDGDVGDGDAGDGDGPGGAAGDGDLGGSAGDGDGDGDGDGTDTLVSNPTDPECDLSGVWAVVTKTRTTAASMDQIANRWYLLEISHDGDEVEVVRASNCHVRVEDDDELISTSVTISDDALRGILENTSAAGLQGTYTKNADVCELDFDRQYFVLGLGDEFLPDDPGARPDLADLTPLPTEGDPSGSEDWDGDGDPGITFSVESLVSGTRSSVQRGYIEFDSDSGNPDYTVELDSSQFTVNNLTAISESVLAASGDFLKSTGSLSGTDHPVTFTRLGDTYESAEMPSGDSLPATAFDLCKALEEEFPFSL